MINSFKKQQKTGRQENEDSKTYGSDGSSRPFALKEINDGTGTVNEDAYTGTKSVSAF